MKAAKVMRSILIIICLGVMLFSLWKLWGIVSEYRASRNAYDDLAGKYVKVEVIEPELKKPVLSDGAGNDTSAKKETVTEAAEETADETAHVPAEESIMITVDFPTLVEECPDVVGWIYSPGTPINYPIVQSDDNEYYLHRLLDGSYNKGGTLFIDSYNQPDFSDWNTFLYGHNMRDNSMFGTVDNYRQKDYYGKHPVMYLLTPEKNYVIELVAGCTIPADSAVYRMLNTVEDRDALVAELSRSSSFKANVELGEDDKLITLSTCVYDYDNARYVVVGVLKEMAE